MPAPTPATHGWTAEMLATLPDNGNRYEIIGGELIVSPSPSWLHQGAVKCLAAILMPYVENDRLGDVVIAPADVVFTRTDVVVPDLFVVPLVNGRLPRDWQDVGRMLLAVEVLSPSSEYNDRQRKLRLYRRERVPEYWIVTCSGRVIERWHPDDERPEVLAETLTWQPFAEREPLVIDLVAFFARVHGEG